MTHLLFPKNNQSKMNDYMQTSHGAFQATCIKQNHNTKNPIQ